MNNCILFDNDLQATLELQDDFNVDMEAAEVVLKTLHITKNGTYTPTDADGYNKVITEITPESAPLVVTENIKTYTPKDVGADAISEVKVEIRKIAKLPSNVIIRDDMLDENGMWLFDSMLDTSNSTAFTNMFSNGKSIKAIDTSSWDTSNVVNFGNMFPSCIYLKKIDVSNWDTSKATNMNRTFTNCTALEEIDVSNWDVSQVTTMAALFQTCNSLKMLDLRNWDVSNCTNLSSAFDCPNLESLVGYATIEEVLSQNICALKGMKVNCLLKTNNLDRASFRAVINGLADLTGQSACTLTLSKYHKDRFTQEDIDIATNKNWTLAWG